jgi:phosphatidylserine decarboxylase
MTDADVEATASEFQSHLEAASTAVGRPRLALEPMDPQLTNIQPGGGVIIRLELAWGRWRRWYLKTFRSGYVARMQALRQDETNPCPHEALDPRDLKFYRNQGGPVWSPENDPFAWRDRLPFARAGLAELLVGSLMTFGSACLLTWLVLALNLRGSAAWFGWLLVVTAVVIGVLIVWFFRDPRREIPQGDALVVSPADGKVVTVEEIEYDEFLEGPAVLIGIFLSIFDVHINRMPIAGRVIGLRYRPGKCLNALRPESAQENEHLAVRLESNSAPHRRMVVRQITGAIARRIVCWLKPGDELEAGAQFGMIKLGSRTELLLPREDGLEITTKVGEKVRAGSSALARYKPSAANSAEVRLKE